MSLTRLKNFLSYKCGGREMSVQRRKSCQQKAENRQSSCEKLGNEMWLGSTKSDWSMNTLRKIYK